MIGDLLVRKESYFRNTDGIIIIYDGSDENSPTLVNDIINDCLQSIGSTPIYSLLIVGDRTETMLSDTYILTRMKIDDLITNQLSSIIKNIGHIRTNLIDAESIDEIFKILIPYLVFSDKGQCYNCLNKFSDVFYHESCFFCKNCIKNPDLEKAKAFSRINN